MTSTNLLKQIRTSLNAASDEKTKNSFQRFFKEPVVCYGVRSAEVRKIIKTTTATIKEFSKSDVFAMCEDFLKSGYCEEAWVAANWAYEFREKFSPKDFELFEKWIDKYIDNWAECDTFCNHTVGAFIEKFPGYVIELKRWAKSKNRWLKRAAAVSLIIPAKEGKFLKDVFELADILLEDPDDMVQKGYGWLLKEASREHQKEVFDYVTSKKSTMPRTALRYAIEKMPESLRKKAMGR